MIVECNELCWPFGREPYVSVGSTKTVVDPTPCYPHNSEVLANTLQIVKRRSGNIPDIEVVIYNSSYEDKGRTNAWATKAFKDYEEKTKTWSHERQIFINGKRIPPHPAVTRYLVGHEYGHHVQWLIEEHFELGESGIIDRYAEARGLTRPAYYGAGTWHATPGEVFACDFRILVAGIEPGYWPHPGVMPPLEHTEVGQWWDHLVTTPPSTWSLL